MREQFLIDQLKYGVSPFHSVAAAEHTLTEAGFLPLSYDKPWNLEKGKKYVMNHHGTALFAFTVGEDFSPGGMLRMAAAHTDYPYLRIKPNADFLTEGYAQVNVEVYGGPVLNTWFDRPLGVAGRVILRSGDVFHPKAVLYRSEIPILIIPNLAIHMNREVNKGVEIKNQVDLMPIADMLSGEQKDTAYFLNFLAEELQVDKKDILDFELNTYCVEEPAFVGVKNTLLSSPRLDNQTSVAALLLSIMEAERRDGVNLIALFDHEEIGNTSKQGAASILLHDMVKRIYGLLGCSMEEMERALYSAMLLSVDVAHALHPNHKEKMDITNRPVLGKGFCVKEACSQSYATDAKAVAIVCQLCEKHQIPFQRFVNRSDVRGGGTLGAVASTLVPVKTVDIGIPLLAMHSARELMGREDFDALVQVVTHFFM
ncbi:MAG: M18 family aminopeptidase [Lachnospiraceae bacterium]|nr:M18 family aminopeptidase [Lachnospiraceae bacterium]